MDLNTSLMLCECMNLEYAKGSVSLLLKNLLENEPACVQVESDGLSTDEMD